MSSMSGYPFGGSQPGGLHAQYQHRAAPYMHAAAAGAGPQMSQRQSFAIQELLGLGAASQATQSLHQQFFTHDPTVSYSYQNFGGSAPSASATSVAPTSLGSSGSCGDHDIGSMAAASMYSAHPSPVTAAAAPWRTAAGSSGFLPLGTPGRDDVLKYGSGSDHHSNPDGKPILHSHHGGELSMNNYKDVVCPCQCQTTCERIH